MSMSGYLDERDDRRTRAAQQAARDGDVLDWLHGAKPPEVRIAAFDRWLVKELQTRLEWGWAGAHAEKRQFQARQKVCGMVIELWRRGWMLDGQRLARHIEKMLDAIGTYQRAGKVLRFWPYFEASVERYVGLHAEEIQAEAMSAGAAVDQVLLRALSARRPEAAPLPELLAQRAQETLREKVNRQKRQQARQDGEQSQGDLFARRA